MRHRESEHERRDVQSHADGQQHHETELKGAVFLFSSSIHAFTFRSNADKVDNMMDDIQDQIAEANEIGEAMSQQIGEPMDEDELLGGI